MDIDEEAFRAGEVRARLYGFLRVPEDRRLMQGAKVGGRGLTDAAAAQAIAERVVEGMQAGRLYLIGPGTTTRAIKDRLGLEGTLLGVDAVCDGRLVARDATEAEIARTPPPRAAGHHRGDRHRRPGLHLRPGQPAAGSGGDPEGRRGERGRGGHPGKADRVCPPAACGSTRETTSWTRCCVATGGSSPGTAEEAVLRVE